MKRNGFSFIELLVVITIMAVIFAAGIVSYTTISKNSRDARRGADLESIRQALEMCRSITGYYPVDIYPSSGSIECDSKVPPTVTMKATPVDPKPCDSKSDGQYSYQPNTPIAGDYILTADCMEDKSKTYIVTNP